MYFFTADEHYGHVNIIRFCNRPFENSFEMDNEIIRRHNEVVTNEDTVIHGGDVSLHSNTNFVFEKYISKLNGKNHIFIKGSHDKWLRENKYSYIWENNIQGQFIIVCHYAMRVWARSHYNSWQLYGHSHGKLNSVGKQWDIGVDNNNFYPVSFNQLVEIMKKQPDNFNLIKKDRNEKE
jgi:calcineurin-like phosphoesterase family protein